MKNLNEMNREELEKYDAQLSEDIKRLREACKFQLKLIEDCKQDLENIGLNHLNNQLSTYFLKLN
jgi:cellobiose-specific phosphotransferase system component IIA